MLFSFLLNAVFSSISYVFHVFLKSPLQQLFSLYLLHYAFFCLSSCYYYDVILFYFHHFWLLSLSFLPNFPFFVPVLFFFFFFFSLFLVLVDMRQCRLFCMVMLSHLKHYFIFLFLSFISNYCFYLLLLSYTVHLAFLLLRMVGVLV